MNIIQAKMEGFMEEIYFHLKNYYFTKKILRKANFYINVYSFLKNKFIFNIYFILQFSIILK